jgi:cytochrome c peroxidase
MWGRFAITKNEKDMYVFRVPSLRNVARTAPYFHDGSVDSLDRAVKIMGRVQLGKELDEEDHRPHCGFPGIAHGRGARALRRAALVPDAARTPRG